MIINTGSRSDLLLPSEKQAIKYQKLHKETTDKLKNVISFIYIRDLHYSFFL